MKIRMTFLFGIIASVLCLCDANAKTITKKCPAGLFCTNNGSYTYDEEHGDIKPYMKSPAEYVTAKWGTMSDELFCSSNCKSSTCVYCAEDYDETWASTYFGFYFIKNGEVTYHTLHGQLIGSIFTCPGTYPSSDEGARSVFECYRLDSNRQKEYYQAPKKTQTVSSENYLDIGTVNALVKDLQSALSKAQALQNALNKSNQGNSTQSAVSSNADIKAMKAMISAGISDTKAEIKNKSIKNVRNIFKDSNL